MEKYGKEVWRYKGKCLGKCGKEEIRDKSLEKYVKEGWRDTGLGRVKGITKEKTGEMCLHRQVRKISIGRRHI